MRFLVLFFLIVVYFLLVFFDIKQFEVWDQIYDGFSPNIGVIDYFDNLVSHTLRLIIMHPIMVFALNNNLEPTTVFSYVAIAIIFTIFIISIYLVSIYAGKLKNKISAILLCLIFVITLLMNGRNLFSFLAFNLFAVYAHLTLYQKGIFVARFFILLTSLFFCSVSSGTLSVLIITNIIFAFLLVYKLRFSRITLTGLLQIFLVLLLFSPIFFIGLEKNLDYYDGSILKMLDHGYGLFLNNIFVILVIPFLAIPFLLLGFKWLKNIDAKKFSFILFPVFAASVVGGSFGYSSLLGGFPILAMGLVLYIYSKKLYV